MKKLKNMAYVAAIAIPVTYYWNIYNQIVYDDFSNSQLFFTALFVLGFIVRLIIDLKTDENNEAKKLNFFFLPATVLILGLLFGYKLSNYIAISDLKPVACQQITKTLIKNYGQNVTQCAQVVDLKRVDNGNFTGVAELLTGAYMNFSIYHDQNGQRMISLTGVPYLK